MSGEYYSGDGPMATWVRSRARARVRAVLPQGHLPQFGVRERSRLLWPVEGMAMCFQVWTVGLRGYSETAS